MPLYIVWTKLHHIHVFSLHFDQSNTRKSFSLPSAQAPEKKRLIILSCHADKITFAGNTESGCWLQPPAFLRYVVIKHNARHLKVWFEEMTCWTAIPFMATFNQNHVCLFHLLWKSSKLKFVFLSGVFRKSGYNEQFQFRVLAITFFLSLSERKNHYNGWWRFRTTALKMPRKRLNVLLCFLTNLLYQLWNGIAGVKAENK